MVPGQKRAEPSTARHCVPEIAFKIAVAKAIDEHTRLGLPVYIWRNSRVVKLSPNKTSSSSRRRK